MKNLSVIFLLLLFLSGAIRSQQFDPPQLQQQWLYDWGSKYDSPTDMIIDKKGNYVIVGYRDVDSVVYLDDGIITKLTPAGQTIWFKVFSHKADTSHYIDNVIDFPNENAYLFVVAGDDYNGAINRLIKMDYDGNIIWQTDYHGWDVQLVAVNDSFIVVETGRRPELITFDLEGNEISRQGISPYNGPKSIILKGDTLLISGWFYGQFTYGNVGAFLNLLKWNPSSKSWDFLWQKEVGNADDGHACFSGGYIYWTMNYYGPYPFTDSSNTFITRKYTIDGDLIWERMWNGTAADNENRSTSVIGAVPYPTGGITAFGTANDTASGVPTAFTYDPDGNLIWWVRDYSNGWANFPTGAYDANRMLVAVEKASVNKDRTFDVILQHYLILDLTPITPPASNIPANFSLAQNYPNPFNAETAIAFTLPTATEVTLEVFNSLGQKVATVFSHRHFSPGTHQVLFNAQNLPSGIYFYKLQAGSFSKIRKMVLIK